MKKGTLLMSLVLLSLIVLFSGCASKGDTGKKAKKIDYPVKPVNMIVPFAAGGSSDLTARACVDTLAKILKQPVVVINKPGASGAIGADEIYRSKGDGYNILNASNGGITIAPYTTQVKYTYKDFKYVAQLTDLLFALSVNANSPIKNLKDFVEYAKANPGKIRYGTPGAGSIQHITGEGWMRKNGIKCTHTPYAGGNPAVAALMGGHIEATFTGITEVVPQQKNGLVRILAVSSAKRTDMVDAPTFNEQGYDLVAGAWYGILVPKSTPDEIVNVLSESVKEIQKDSKVTDAWKRLSLIPNYLGPKDFEERVRKEAEGNQVILKEIGLAKK